MDKSQNNDKKSMKVYYSPNLTAKKEVYISYIRAFGTVI